MSLRIGETFAGYRILRLLGAGGMGEVYLVQHPRLPRHEALKVLRADVSSDPSFRDRFIREADLAAGLRHPHIVAIHDRGEYHGHLWIAMDYIEGIDGSRLLNQRYPAGMAADTAISVIADVANALDYAHRKGLLHRDVKPANIIVDDLDTDERRVVLTDFGIARPIEDNVGLTATNTTVGTVAYAAPEQLMGEQIDGRADQYALAVTAYQLLSGALPFAHSNPAVVISHHLNASPPALSGLRPELAHLDPVIAAALSKDPNDRFEKCLDFAGALATGQAVKGTRSASLERTALAPVALHPEARPPTKLLPAERPLPPTRLVSTSHPEPPNVFEEPSGPRGPAIVGALAVMVLLAAVVFAFVARPWQQERASDGAADPPAPSTPLFTFESMRDFIASYYANLPARPHDAWAMVSPQGHDGTGQSEFVDFWSRIESVDLVSITRRDATSVVARLAYVRKDGGSETEDRVMTMAVVGGAMRLQKSERIGRVTDLPQPPATTAEAPSMTVETPASNPNGPGCSEQRPDRCGSWTPEQAAFACRAIVSGADYTAGLKDLLMNRYGLDENSAFFLGKEAWYSVSSGGYINTGSMADGPHPLCNDIVP